LAVREKGEGFLTIPRRAELVEKDEGYRRSRSGGADASGTAGSPPLRGQSYDDASQRL